MLRRFNTGGVGELIAKISVFMLVSLFSASLFGGSTVSMNSYKPLNEVVESEHYQLTKILDGIVGVFWDEKNNVFVFLRHGQNLRVGNDGELTAFTRWKDVSYAVFYNTVDELEEKVIYLSEQFKNENLDDKAAYEYLTKLYDNASTFVINEMGWRYDLYFHADNTWYVLKYDGRDTDKALVKSYVKFAKTYEDQQKDEYLVEIEPHKDTQYEYDYDWKKKSNLIRLDDFIKEYTESEFSTFLPQIPTYHEGPGLYTLKHQGDDIRFRFKTKKKYFSLNKYWGYLRVYKSPLANYADRVILEASDPNDDDNVNGIYLVHPK